MTERPRHPDPERHSTIAEMELALFETLGAFFDVPPEWRGRQKPSNSERPGRKPPL